MSRKEKGMEQQEIILEFSFVTGSIVAAYACMSPLIGSNPIIWIVLWLMAITTWMSAEPDQR